MARRTFNSIESTADQAEAFVHQGRLGDAERHYRELIGQTHVINYEYDDWLRRLGDIYKNLGRQREAAFVYLYLHYFDMARGLLVGDEHIALRARLAEIEKKWGDILDRPAVSAELRVHGRRVARLERIVFVAESEGKTEVAAKATTLLEQERARHEQRMQSLRAEGSK